MPAPDCTFNMTMICAGVLLIPSLLDFAYLTIDTEGWDSAAVVAPAWYPISGVILAVLFLYGGYKGKKEPGSTKCILIIGMIVGIGNICVVAYYGVIGVVLSTVCAAVELPAGDAGVTEYHSGVTEFCNMMSLLTLSCIVRFIATLCLLVSSCMGVCCLDTGIMVIQQPVIMIPQPGMAQPAPIMMVAVQAQPAP